MSKGECGVIIKSVENKHFGKWTCKVVRMRRDGKYGSESAIKDLVLVPKKSRAGRALEANQKQLQGFNKGHEGAEINLNVNIGKRDYNNVTIYWIVQRKYLVQEGELFCANEEESDCLEARSRRKIKGMDNQYRMKMIIDELREKDIEEPMVLVKQYYNERNKFSVEMIHVDKTDDSLIKELSDMSDKAEQDGCNVNGMFLDVGETYELEEECIEIKCTNRGHVDIQALTVCSVQ